MSALRTPVTSNSNFCVNDSLFKITLCNFFQVFSVRVRDKGPDYRGFVQLLTESDPLSAGISELEDGTLISPNAALCFVDTCQRSFDASVLKCHVSYYSLCVFIKFDVLNIKLNCYVCFRKRILLYLLFNLSHANTLMLPSDVLLKLSHCF